VAAGCLVAVSSGCTGEQQVSLQPQVSFQGYSGTAVVSTDGMTITVGRYPPPGSCEAIFPVARQSKTQVALFLEDVARGCGGEATPPTDGGEVMPVFASNIRLPRPLGNRELVNGATGQAIPWISSRFVLRPADSSYRLTTIEPTGDVSADHEVAAGATQQYIQLGSPNELYIVQSAHSVDMPVHSPSTDQDGWTPIRVRGYPGRATLNVITWRENGLTDYIQILTGDPNDPQILTTQQLIALADSAMSYSPGPLPNCCPPH